MIARGALALVVAFGGAAGARSEHLSDRESAAVVAALKSAKTGDGSTVSEVLAFAHKMRPAQFKLGDIEPVYDSGRNYLGVSICYFVGAKRLPDDAYCMDHFEVDRGTKAVAKAKATRDWRPSKVSAALMSGRDAFLDQVDREYADDCVEADTGRKLC